ncbi:membrane protein [Streptococcus pneumoniae]|nr:membrane protein [Streptococcus pneumoniae]VPW69200.1 membrane protein [Streptococcus pneumoniae]
MKSLRTLLTYHLLFSSLLIFIIISGNLPIDETFLVLVFILALNKGLTYLKIDSPKTRTLNLALYFMILSLPQLMLVSGNWKYYLLLTIASLSSITYLYYLYQLVKEVNQKPFI